jgi:hypothetical protein
MELVWKMKRKESNRWTQFLKSGCSARNPQPTWLQQRYYRPLLQINVSKSKAELAGIMPLCYIFGYPTQQPDH